MASSRRPGLNGGSHKVGALTLRCPPATQIARSVYVDLGSTILCCTPSNAAYLGESIEEMGLRDQIKLKAASSGPKLE
jgi:phenylacetate-CoA ligase